MKEVLLNFPEQIKKSFEIVEKTRLPRVKNVRNIVIAGMGGSAIGADLLRSYLYNEIPFTFEVVRHYEIPAYVNKNTLFIASSYSGNTEETLSALSFAKLRTKNIIAITSNGKLESEVDYVIKIPSGLQPRCALGYLFFSVLFALIKLKLIRDVKEEVEETYELLKKKSDEFSSEKGAPHRLASKLLNKFAIIYCDDRIMPVARRWAGQLAENSKIFSHFNVFPEMNHNEIVGIGEPPLPYYVLFLRTGNEHQKVQKRFEIVKEIIRDFTIYEDIFAEGKSFLSRIFYLVYFGDWVSYHLAVLRGVDPTPIERINYLKKRLSE